VGILTDGDLRRALCTDSLRVDAPVSTIMTKNFRHASKSMKAAEVLDIMEKTAITVLPVLNADKRPLGMVHVHDLLGKGQIKFGV